MQKFDIETKTFVEVNEEEERADLLGHIAVSMNKDPKLTLSQVKRLYRLTPEEASVVKSMLY